MFAIAVVTGSQVCTGGAHEYCCPDAKHCLTATTTTCRESANCGSDETCCPLTKLCVKVGAPCAPPCKDSYCCPGSGKVSQPRPLEFCPASCLASRVADPQLGGSRLASTVRCPTATRCSVQRQCNQGSFAMLGRRTLLPSNKPLHQADRCQVRIRLKRGSGLHLVVGRGGHACLDQ
jgi:hypothetical protein